MRSLIVLCVLWFGVANVSAQLSDPLLFNEKIHDFGEIIESKGPANFEFTFVNNSGRPVKILTVAASCGCTTPGWVKEVVPPGGRGFIKASYDPKGRPGYFNKTLTVTTDLGGAPIVLQVKGTVVEKLSSKADVLPVANGNLRLKNNSFNLGKLFINRPAVVTEFEVANAGESSIDFIGVTAPAYIKVETPASLKHDESGVIKITYDAKKRSQYGFLSDNIEIKTNDAATPLKSFSVYATVEEYFPVLTSTELASAPVLGLELAEADFARVKKGTVVEKKVIIKNTGKKNLDIRYIQPNCTCLKATTDKSTLKPGEAGVLTLSLTTEGRAGTQNKAATIYSNDPRNPVQRVTLTGYIED